MAGPSEEPAENKAEGCGDAGASMHFQSWLFVLGC